MQKINQFFFAIMYFNLIFILCSSVHARTKTTEALKKSGDLKIPESSCNQIENKLGQLFYVNVDGYGQDSKDEKAIHPDYIAMVRDLQIGGVLPHTMSNRASALKNDFSALKKATAQPLLVGVDYQQIWYNKNSHKEFGMGYGAGFLKTAGYASEQCISSFSYLDAFFHRSAGLNQSLGPTIEKNKNHGFLNQDVSKVAPNVSVVMDQFDHLGVATTMKHFPYTPEDFNLHNKSEDTKISEEKVFKMLEIFKVTADKTDFAMSTHLYNSNIDSENVATFSKAWVDILRKRLGFNGILMTDGLFMFNAYPDSEKLMASKWPQDQVPIDTPYDNSSIFAARALLAGHDMVFLEGSSRSTYRVFDNLMKVACQDKPVSSELRARIFESYDRISKWKSTHKEQLLQEVVIPEELENEAIRLYTNKCPDPKAFAAFKEKVDKLGFKPNSRGLAQPLVPAPLPLTTQ